MSNSILVTSWENNCCSFFSIRFVETFWTINYFYYTLVCSTYFYIRITSMSSTTWRNLYLRNIFPSAWIVYLYNLCSTSWPCRRFYCYIITSIFKSLCYFILCYFNPSIVHIKTDKHHLPIQKNHLLFWYLFPNNKQTTYPDFFISINIHLFPVPVRL